MLTIAPGVPAAMWRRPNSRAQRKLPVSTMSITERQPFGERSSAGTGKLPGGVVDEHAGKAELALDGVEGGGHLVVAADVAGHAERLPAGGPTAATPAARCSSPRETIATRAPSRANSTAIALPSPVPPPVTSTVSPAKLPAGSAAAPGGGGSGRPMETDGSTARGSGTFGPHGGAQRRDGHRRAALPRRGPRRRRHAEPPRGAERAHLRDEARRWWSCCPPSAPTPASAACS